MIRDYPSIETPNGVYEWAAPIDYGDVAFSQAPGWQDNGTLYRDGSLRESDGRLVNGPTWQRIGETDRWGLRYNGTDTYVQLPAQTQSALAFPQNTHRFGFSAWVAITVLNVRAVFGASYRGASLYSGSSFMFENVASRGFRCLRCTLSTGLGLSEFFDAWTANNRINDSLPHHVVFTSAAAGGLQIWLDGVHQTPLNYLNDSKVLGSGDSEAPFRLGALSDGLLPLSGDMADPLLTTTPFSPDQIRWLANPANNPWQPWERRHWSFAAVAAAGRKPWQIRRQRRMAGKR